MIISALIPTWTPVPVADTTAMTDGGHHTIQGGTSSQRCELRKVEIAGQAGASAPTILVLGRTSTVGATLTALRLAANDGSSVLIANPPVSYAASTTKPQRSATLGMLANLGINAYGGLLHWFPGPDQRIASIGNTASLGELSLNAFSGGTPGAISSNIVLETV
ncbi:hypothetical protein [Luteitalea sp.]|uniref:hypothetical protein n=1 Tax=Luteitalea sp. TaxID=2004800 RepID=UPI0025BC14E1|nr:hypothetical protein [Luteitalea sp.]